MTKKISCSVQELKKKSLRILLLKVESNSSNPPQKSNGPSLSVEDLASYLHRSHFVQVMLDSSKVVRLCDPNPALHLACQLEGMLDRKAALSTYGNKSFLLLSNDRNLIMVDGHKNGNFGTVGVKGKLAELPQYLNSIESVLGIN